MRKIQRLNDLYREPFTYGILYDMFVDEKFDDIFVRLGIDEDSAHALDVEYIYNISGLKTVSTLICGLLNEFIIDDTNDFVEYKGDRITYEKFITEIDKKIIRTIIYNKFFLKWKELIDTLFIDYDVTNPYHMNVDDNVKFDSSVNNKKENTYTSNGSNNGNTSQNGSGSNGIYGFNSINSVNADDYNDNSSVEESYTHDRTDSGNESDTSVKDSTTNRRISRTGNIGNRSVTELIEERREMLKYQIFDIIFSDLDSVLTRSKYI